MDKLKKKGYKISQKQFTKNFIDLLNFFIKFILKFTKPENN